ncbi:MAG: signal peptidase II [Candidatus Xenobia bacterium]
MALEAAPPTPPRAESRWGAYRLFLVAALVFVADQLTKAMVVRTLMYREIRLGPWLSLDFVRNQGGAFGILQHVTALFVVAGVAVAVGIFLYRRQIAALPTWQAVAFGLVLGGTMGNLLDRLRLGYVVDFVDLHWWPVFNVADSCICVGLGLVALAMWRSHSAEPPADHGTAG